MNMGSQTVDLRVNGMTCDHCARSVERKLAATPGVSKAKVDLGAAKATVEFDPERAKVPDLVAAIEQLGYSVPV